MELQTTDQRLAYQCRQYAKLVRDQIKLQKEIDDVSGIICNAVLGSESTTVRVGDIVLNIERNNIDVMIVDIDLGDK